MGRKFFTKPRHLGYHTAVEAHCDKCSVTFWETNSHYQNKSRHFCSTKCYAEWRRDDQPIQEHSRWQGGVTYTESHRRWKAKNPERMAHLKARRYARERNAKGSHTFEEWNALKQRHGNRCAHCGEAKPMTKDHIVPLSEGGTDYISNIQPLCRACNSRKWKKLPIYQNPELLE